MSRNFTLRPPSWILWALDLHFVCAHLGIFFMRALRLPILSISVVDWRALRAS